MTDLSYNKTVTLAHIISVCEKVNKYFFFGEIIFSFSM